MNHIDGETPASGSGAEVVGMLGEIRDVLRQIRDVLAYVAIPPPPAEQPPGCTHPAERRADLSSMGETRWKCRDCRYEHVAPRLTAAVESATTG